MAAIRTLLCALLAAPAAWAGPLEIPLRVPLEAVEKALAAQLPASPNAIYREGPCRFLNLDAPAISAAAGELRLATPGSAALGAEFFGRCRNVADWQGTMHVRLVPWIDGAGRLRLRILDSRLADSRGRKGVPMVWQLAKRQVHPHLENFSYDIGASRNTLLSVLRGAAPAGQAAAFEQVLASLQVLQPRVEAKHVVVPVAINLPDAWLASGAGASAPSLPAVPLTDAELDALDKTLQPWDAFLSYVIKHAARDSDPELRQRLFTLLLDSRYQLAAVLAGEATTSGDPVRALFIDVWGELRSILADARYSLFVDAGDALLALDRAAPALGATISADGLRQLARSFDPAASGDPLAYDWAVDPDLGRLFDVQEPPRSELPPERSWLDFFIASAFAAEQQPLDRWVPTREQLAVYEPRIGALLRKAAATELERVALDAPYDQMYRAMVPTTALIESCWRQYVTRSGKVSYLRSQSGSIGIMQINQVVWRGFYDVQRLRWDTAYNVRAGAQILMRYTKDYAIPYASKSGDPNHVPRAAYAVYNAGPRAVGRFTRNPPHPREQRVDEHLWTLYEGIAAGGQADLRTCGVSTVSAQ